MRVLLVEDDSSKSTDVVGLLELNGVPPQNIFIATDARSALNTMRTDRFDLAIVDLVLPEREGEDPRRLGGLKLIREVRDRHRYEVPLQFVILSAFDDVVDEAGNELADEVLLALHYSKSSLAWRDRLSRQILHLAKVLDTPAASRPLHADVCVMTALRQPELTAVLDLPWGWEEVQMLGDGSLYYRGRVAGADGEMLSIVAANCSGMGMAAAAILASKMCMHFSPRYLAMCGIMAGVDRDLGLGDVVVADRSWNYESGKRTVTDVGSPEFRSAPDQIPLDAWFRERAKSIAADQPFLDSVRRDFKGDCPNTALAMHVGPVASGSSVVSDQDFLKDAKEQHRKLLGIEMETYGVFAAVEEAAKPRPIAISIKSISDYADAEKSDSYQPFAAYTSAAVLRQLVEKYISADSA